MTTPLPSGLRRRQVLASSLALSALGGASAALAQAEGNWPNRLIRIVVPNPAGGTADLLPRLLAEPLASRLGQAVVIDNKPGAAGNIGAEMVSNAEPDGYTLLAAPPTVLSINVSLYPKLNYNPARFVPISVLATVPNVLMVHPSLPVNTVQEFLAYARANPEKLSYASQGSGSTAHLTAELFKLRSNTRMVHVPYKGDAPAVADLLAGHVQLMFGNIAAASAHARSGKVRILAVTSPKRLAALPNTPAMNEIVPGVVAVTWFGLVAPPNTPLPIAKKLSAMVADILRMPEIQRRFAEVSAEPVGNTPEEMAAWMKEETENWAAVIKSARIQVD
ncbi:MAG: Bug family tripartite tricarboxylate transporter substrate binding protein [Hylemonella sp.]